jgi:predicted  nucleic acid-binding Zn-ribbon protein
MDHTYDDGSGGGDGGGDESDFRSIAVGIADHVRAARGAPSVSPPTSVPQSSIGSSSDDDGDDDDASLPLRPIPVPPSSSHKRHRQPPAPPLPPRSRAKMGPRSDDNDEDPLEHVVWPDRRDNLDRPTAEAAPVIQAAFAPPAAPRLKAEDMRRMTHWLKMEVYDQEALLATPWYQFALKVAGLAWMDPNELVWFGPLMAPVDTLYTRVPAATVAAQAPIQAPGSMFGFSPRAAAPAPIPPIPVQPVPRGGDDARIAALEAEVARLRRENDERTAKLERVANEREAAKRDVERLRREKEEVEERATDLRSKVEASEAATKDLRERLRSVNLADRAAAKQVQQQLDTTQAVLAMMQREVAALREAGAADQTYQRDLLGELGLKTNEVEQLRRQVTLLQTMANAFAESERTSSSPLSPRGTLTSPVKPEPDIKEEDFPSPPSQGLLKSGGRAKLADLHDERWFQRPAAERASLVRATMPWLSRPQTTGVVYLNPNYWANRASAYSQIQRDAPALRAVPLSAFMSDPLVSTDFAACVAGMMGLRRHASGKGGLSWASDRLSHSELLRSTAAAFATQYRWNGRAFEWAQGPTTSRHPWDSPAVDAFRDSHTHAIARIRAGLPH